MADTLRAPHPSDQVRPVAGDELPDDGRHEQRQWWRVPPVDRRGLAIWVLAYVLMAVVATAVGLLVVHELGGVRALDRDVAHRLAAHRTNTWDAITWSGSMIADAYVKVPLTIVFSVVFLWRWRRWTEPALLAGALLLEVAAFLTSSFVVDRARPPIPHLDPVPPTGAFPSGHSAAAVAFYGAIAIIVFWHTRNAIGRALAVTAAVLVPLAVGTSRMYRGMHHLSDVVVGLVIGVISLWVTWWVVRRGPATRELAPGPSQ
jgi:undecaprenyl-diphosphatase